MHSYKICITPRRSNQMAYFWPILTPLPLSHFVTHPGTPQKYVTPLGPPRFLVGLVQKPGQKPPVQILYQLLAGVFVRGFVRGSFVWKVLSGVVFVYSPFCQNTSVTTES